MTVRQKTQGILAILLGCLTILTYGVTRVLLLRDAERAEDSQVARDIARIQQTLESELNHLDTLLVDWSAWDDTYTFVQGQNLRYSESNLTFDTFSSNGHRIAVFLDVSNRVVFQGAYLEPATEVSEIPSELLSELISPDSPLLHLPDREGVKGVLWAGGEALLIASRQILTSLDQGPPMGTLIFGRPLDAAEIQRISDQTQVPLNLHKITDMDSTDIMDLLMRGSGNVIQKLDLERKAGFSLIRDIYGDPVFVLEVITPREIYQQSLAGQKFILLSMILIGVGAYVAVGYSLDRLVNRRLKNLHTFVNRIGQTSDLEERIALVGKDELSDCANAFNQLLARLNEDIKAKEQAQHEQARLVTAIEQSVESVVIASPDGIIRYVNSAFEAMTGYRKDEVIGIHVSKVDRTGMDGSADAWAVAERGEVVRGRMAGHRKDGSTFEIYATFSPVLEDDGTITGIVKVSSDVTREAAMEAQLRQAQKLEAIGTLAGGIAHDFNNLLVPIMGLAELALSETGPEHPLRHHLGGILAASSRAKDLVGQILLFCRQGETEQRELTVAPLLKETLAMLRAVAPRGIVVDTVIEARDASVYGDPTQVHQLVMNLCTNACHAMEENGGTLRVTLSRKGLPSSVAAANPDLNAEDEYVLVSVSDTGVGMDARTLERIYDPFFTTKPQEKGTGLGLATVHGIVAALHGAIAVESEPGMGTRFDVYVPQFKSVPTPIPEVPAPVTSSQGESILLVDDETMVLDVGQRMLKSLGYVVYTASSGQEALEFFSNHPDSVDVVLSDLSMPHMNGLQLAEEIRSISPETAVLLVSGYGDSARAAIQDSALASPVILQKPYTKRDLSIAIQGALAHRGAAGAG